MDSQEDDTFDLPPGYGMEVAKPAPASTGGPSAGTAAVSTGGM